MRNDVKNGELIVPPDRYFVLGDNRDESLDSRYWGFVPRENVIGRPLVIYWSFERDLGPDDDHEPDGKLNRLAGLFTRLYHDTRWNRTLRLVR
jgi:signal peptidase I